MADLIHYRTRADLADENQRLIEAVFADLRANPIAGLRYCALRLPDARFFHLVAATPGASITTLESFREFQRGVRSRCVDLPEAGGITIVGNHGMLVP